MDLSARSGPGLAGWEESAAVHVVSTVLDTEPRPLTEVEGSSAAYLIFYAGPCTCYAPIADGSWPIYAGRTDNLTARLSQHCDSIGQARGLQVRDFWAVAHPIRGRAAAMFAEETLVDVFQPVWNQWQFSGFGSKNQGRVRARNQSPTAWDRLHPGRAWATSATLSRRLRTQAKEYLESLDRRNQGWIIPGASPPPTEEGPICWVPLGQIADDFAFLSAPDGVWAARKIHTRSSGLGSEPGEYTSDRAQRLDDAIPAAQREKLPEGSFSL